MDSLLVDEKKQTEKNDLRTSMCYYLSIIMVLVTFILSCVSMGLCSSFTIQNKIYTYNFPFYDKYITIPSGMPVSIDSRGYAFPGAGTTIYRNVTNKKIDHAMKNVKLRDLAHNMAVAIYKGGCDTFRTTRDGETYSVQEYTMRPLSDGKTRDVDDVITMSPGRYIVVGSRELLPLTVKVSRVNKVVYVEYLEGTPLKLVNNDDMYPHVDTLTNTTIALIYENDLNIYVRTGRWNGEGYGASISVGKEIFVSLRYDYHGVAGMDASHFIIAATGRLYNSTYPPVVTVRLCTIISEENIRFNDWKYLPWTRSHNYFDMDNLNRNDVIMAFSDSSSGGIDCVMVHFDRVANEILFGASRKIQTGGAVLTENRMDMRVLGRNKFAVFYEDNAIQGLVVVQGSVTPSSDITITSANYVISRVMGQYRQVDFYFDLCDTGDDDFLMVEYRYDGFRRSVMVHRGEVMPRPFGIAQKSNKGKLTVQFAGIFKIKGSRKLHAGNSIYTNSMGELIEGRSYGYVNRDFGNFYEYSRDGNMILSQTSIVGIAVTDKKIYLKL